MLPTAATSESVSLKPDLDSLTSFEFLCYINFVAVVVLCRRALDFLAPRHFRDMMDASPVVQFLERQVV